MKVWGDMMKRLGASFILVMICMGAFWACTEKDATVQIRELIATGAVLAQDHDIGGLLDLTTEDVRAMPMDLGRSGIKGLLWRTFNYYGPLKVLYPRVSVEIEEGGKAAQASTPFLIVKQEQTFPGLDTLRDDPLAWLDGIGENADLYRLKLELTRTGNDWRVHHATVERFTGLGFAE